MSGKRYYRCYTGKQKHDFESAANLEFCPKHETHLEKLMLIHKPSWIAWCVVVFLVGLMLGHGMTEDHSEELKFAKNNTAYLQEVNLKLIWTLEDYARVQGNQVSEVTRALERCEDAHK